MLSKYYQSELAYLRELGREFGQKNPGLADALSERGADPDVERLVESFAFLAARTRERSEAAIPELLEPLAELLAPQTLTPIPAATILELTPRHGALRARQTVRAGSLFGSRVVDGVSCPFRIVSDVEIAPMWLRSVTLDDERADHPALVIALETTEQGEDAAFTDSPLRFFIAATHALATTLLLAIARHVESVSYRPDRSAPRERWVSLGPRAASVPLDTGDLAPLWPWPETSTASARYLAEHLVFPEAHAFFDVRGLERVPASSRARRFELVLQLRKPPRLPERLAADALRLHCAPAINLFATSAEPIRREPLRAETLIRAAGLAPHQAEVFEVVSARGRRPKRAGDVVYRPLAALESERARDDFYRLVRRRSVLDDGVDTYIALGSRADVAPSLVDEIVSLEVLATSRRLPHALRPGDVGSALPSSPQSVVARNVTRVSNPIPSPLGTELEWRLLGHIAVSYRSLGTVAALRQLLALHAVPEEIDAHGARVAASRMSALAAVSTTASARPYRGALVRGIETTLELDEPSLEGVGDAFVLGCALSRLFAAEVPLGSFSALRARLSPSGKELSWTPRTGTQPLL